jgi:branched-chain amino acid aminotransferase
MTESLDFRLRPGLPPASPVPAFAEPLVFGRLFTEHMARAVYGGSRWHDAEVTRFEPLPLSPSAAALHYGQTVFEGLKAFRLRDGGIGLFRPDRHARRFRQSSERLCMPALPAEAFVNAVTALVHVDRDWVPTMKDASLYVRPAMIATEPFLGVRPAREYLFFVIASPVSAYYAEGFAPVRIWIEREFVRAAPGGVGGAKTGANYAASLLAAERAHERGYAQVLWTDAAAHELIEEVGTMNVFVRFRDKVVTPPLTGSLLAGVTRDAVLQLLKDWSVPAVERPIRVDEIAQAAHKGDLLEIFGTGTGAVISPVSHLGWDGGTLQVGDGNAGELSKRLFAELTGIQRGDVADRHGWIQRI